MDAIKENADKAAAFLKGLASAHRLQILCHLVEGEKSVSELIEETGLPQTSMSQHLSKLKNEGIVTFRRDHRVLYYRIHNDVVYRVMDVLYHAFCEKNKKGE